MIHVENHAAHCRMAREIIKITATSVLFQVSCVGCNICIAKQTLHALGRLVYCRSFSLFVCLCYYYCYVYRVLMRLLYNVAYVTARRAPMA